MLQHLLGDILFNVVALFTPTSSHISNARFTHSLLLAWQQAGAVKRTTSNDGFVIVRRFVVKPVLFTGNNNNNNNTLIYIAPACRMTSEALADSSSRATECLTEK